MATLAQIILIIACACFVDCRYMRGRSRSHKQSSADHQEVVSRTDFDAVVFPQDDTDDDASKKVEGIITNKQDDNLGVNKTSIDSKAPTPLISKVLPAEVKDATVNAVEHEEMVIDKYISKKDSDKETDVKQVAVINNNNGIETKLESSANFNKTKDLSTRFGETGNYMLVPVANNQNYQSLQTANPPYFYNTQGIVPQTPTNTMQYTTNIAPNTSSNQIGPIQYPAPNVFNPSQSTKTYVPVNVQNTYMINGQMYAAVSVPNNQQVLSPLYVANSQTPGYQVQNNVPMYKLVTLNDGSPQVNMKGNLQFVSN